MGIAADIQRELDKRKWTPWDLHKASGVLYPTLRSMIDVDSNPRIDNVILIARAFGITIDELINNPKPVRKVSKKPMSAKDLKKVLIEYGVGPDDIDVVMDVIRSTIKRGQSKERRSGNGEAESPVT